MEKEFVSYEQAVELKELGFNESCFGYYDNKSKLTFNTNNNPVIKDWLWIGNECIPVDMILAPLKQQVLRWFMEKYNYWSYVYPYIHDKTWHFHIQFYNSDMWGEAVFGHSFNTYEEAENACIDKLIEITKQ